MILSIICLVIAISAYSCGQLQIMGKLKFERRSEGFWGDLSWTRKYKNWPKDRSPAFPGSTTWAIAITDGYHLMQAISFLCLSLSFGFLTSNWWYAGGAYLVIHIVHFLSYRFLSKSK